MFQPGRSAFKGNRFLVASAALIAWLPMAAQAGLPPTAPTRITASQLPSANPVPAAKPGSMDVSWDSQTLQVTANNASLNALLQSVATRTGTQIRGSVPEDRIFGTYGPGSLISVLSELLDGVPVNVFFLDRKATKPAELILTSRTGGPSPPMPQAQPPQEAASSPPSPGFDGGSVRWGQPASRIQNAAPDSRSQTYGAGGAPATDLPASTGTDATPASPNGVKTPEEIFEQLQRLRATAQTSR